MSDIMQLVMDKDPQEREFHQAVRSYGVGQAGAGSKPRVPAGQDTGKACGARKGDYVQSALDGRSGRGAGQPGIPN